MSPLYEDPCPYCGINYDLVYLCADCHEVMCADCVISRTEESYVCLNCGHTEINTNKQGVLYCTQCQSNEIQTLHKIHQFCPNCQGGNVEKISEKQSQLIDDFKGMVSETRGFLTPIDQFMNSLNEKRQSLIHLREDDPKCFHHSNLESEFLVIFKLFDATKKNLYDQVSGYFNELQRHLNYIVEIPRTYPNNLPFIEGILKNLRREKEKITQNAQDAIIPLTKRYDEINTKITSMEEIQALFLSFNSKLQLEAEEKIVSGMKCKLADGSNAGSDISGKNGTILITSKRLIFFQEQGVFKKKMVLLFSVKLEDLQQVGVKGRLKKTVSLDFVNSMYNFSLTKDKREELIEWIEKARVFEARNILDNTNLEKFERYKLDIKQFREELENAIFELIGFKGLQLQQNSLSKPNLIDRTLNSPMYRRKDPPYPSMNSPTTRGSMDITGPFSRKVKNEWDPPTFDERRPNGSNTIPNQYPSYPQNAPQDPYYTSFPTGIQSPRSVPSQPDPYKKRVNYGDPTYDDDSAYRRPATPRWGPSRSYPAEDEPTQIFHPAPEYDPYSIPRQPSFVNRGVDQDLQHQSMLRDLKQEEFGLLQTVKMLEQRFDGGMMNNVEFVKNYRTLQKELYVIQEKIRQMQQAFA
jgi:hypothetical protein